MVRFLECGARVRSRRSPYLMHHKFAVVDGRKVLSGSFNWTMQAVMGNWENVVVTTDRETVRSFVREFEKIWEEFGRPQEREEK